MCRTPGARRPHRGPKPFLTDVLFAIVADIGYVVRDANGQALA
jgi:hypothetical protein